MNAHFAVDTTQTNAAHAHVPRYKCTVGQRVGSRGTLMRRFGDLTTHTRGHTPAGEESNLFPPLWNSLGKGKRGESRFSKRKSFPISRGKGARANKGFTTMDADGNADGIGQGDTEMTVRRYTCFRLVPSAVWESLWPDHRISFDAPRLIRAETSSRCRNRAAHPQALSPLRPASRLNNGAHIRRAIRHTPPPRFQQMPPFLSL